jgi:hypothetical protein
LSQKACLIFWREAWLRKVEDTAVRSQVDLRGNGSRAIRNVCRLQGLKAINALPGAIRAATLALLGPHV